jgi:signal transduction histidine kinase
VGSPIFVDGRVWGAVIVATRESSPLAPDAERRIAAFTELAATAIANAQARDDLRASRQRVVDSADAMRRRMERNLHDGVQQQLVTLGLEVGMLRSRVPADSPLREEMEALRLAVEAVHEELRVFSRGLHPSILSHGGLAAALRSLANASPLPVTVDSNLEHRLPEGVEVTAYYVVSEALANAAKHAQASTVLVQVDLVGSRLRIEVRDDGRGGALQSRGSGLVGLRDRVEARSGTMTVTSPPGAGTTIQVDLPVEPEPS